MSIGGPAGCGASGRDAEPTPPIPETDNTDAGERAEADAQFGDGDGGALGSSCFGGGLELIAPPAGFPPLAEPSTNPNTLEGAALGRRLFFDRRLSANGRVSCATCHAPEGGFADGVALSRAGVSGNALARHAPSLWNVAWLERGLFWDGGSKNLESLSLAPLTHPDEMGRAGELDALLAELARDATYPAMFERAFGAEALTLSNVLRALAQFQRRLIAADARWDARAATPLSAEEIAGERVFERHCARCHVPATFSDGNFHNNGLDPDFSGPADDPKQGRARISLASVDRGKYKTPGLRDVERSAPYMHDGRFITLEQVIEHYRSGMTTSSTIDPGFLRPDERPGVPMSDREASELRAFLSTLSERTTLTALTAPDCEHE